MASSKSTLNVHLIGKQGSGKSATGNSILQREAFRSVQGFEAVTVDLKSEEVFCHGRLLRVWDGPGVTEDDAQLVQIVKNIHDTVGARKPESHVLLWVFRYGEPCSVVDEHLLKELTKTFEQDFVKANSAVVVTYKDNFDFDVEGLHLTFETWMKEQAGLFGELCQMSDYKVLPINNRMKTEEQTQQLLSLLLGTEKGHVLEDVRHVVGEENGMCQDDQRQEQQTERDTCPLEQQTERDTCPLEQQTGRDTCPLEQQTERDTYPSEQQTERDTYPLEQQTERDICPLEQQTERDTYPLEQQTERDTYPSEQQTERDTYPSEQQTERDTCPLEQQTEQGMSKHSSASGAGPLHGITQRQ